MHTAGQPPGCAAQPNAVFTATNLKEKSETQIATFVISVTLPWAAADDVLERVLVSCDSAIPAGHARNSQNSRTSIEDFEFLEEFSQGAALQTPNGSKPPSLIQKQAGMEQMEQMENSICSITATNTSCLLRRRSRPQQAALAVNRAESIPFTHSPLAIPLTHFPLPTPILCPWSSEWRMESRDRTIWLQQAEARPFRERFNTLRLSQPGKITMRTWPPVLSFLAKANDSTGKEKVWPVVVTRREG
jgi:hypothetical protein